MDSRLSIENVTSGLLTLQKLKQLYKPVKREDSSSSSGSSDNSSSIASYVQPDKLSLLQETLSAITTFIPETRGVSFNDAFKQANHYSSSYRGMKQQVRDMSGKGLDGTQVLKSLKLVIPVLGNKQRLYMEKLVKVFDILQS